MAEQAARTTRQILRGFFVIAVYLVLIGFVVGPLALFLGGHYFWGILASLPIFLAVCYKLGDE